MRDAWRDRRGRLLLVAVAVTLVVLAPVQRPSAWAAASLFGDEFENGSASAWTVSAGNWSVASETGTTNHVYRQTKTSGRSMSIAGSSSWADYAVQVRVNPTTWKDGGAVSVAGRVVDASNFYELVVTKSKRVQLARVTGGTSTLLAVNDQAVPSGAWTTLRLEFKDNLIRGFVNGVKKVYTTDTSFHSGKVALRTASSTADFDSVAVTTGLTNEAPEVEAGPDQTVAVAQGADLEGLAGDDGLPQLATQLQCQWSTASGPGSVAFQPNAGALTAHATFNTAGTYKLKLTCSDGERAGTDTVPITAVTGTPPPPPPATDAPVGWASVDAWGEDGTTGGAGGKSITVENQLGLLAYSARAEPFVIHVNGMIMLPGGMHNVTSNKTIIGVGAKSGVTSGGFTIGVPVDETMTSVPPNAVHNIIIRNMVFKNSPIDAINVQMFSHHIWIDHNDLARAFDGLVDIKRGSSYVTVSWNHAHGQTKNMLLGANDQHGAQDQGRLKVTYHHNWFDGTAERSPRARFGEPVHVFNNYYLANSDYGIACQADSGCWVEGNYFENVKVPMTTTYAGPPGRIVERNNIYVNSGAPQTAGQVEDPSTDYAYVQDDPADVKDIVRAGAGTGIVG